MSQYLTAAAALFILLILQLTIPLKADDRVIDVIPLQHSLTSEVIPVLEPLLEPGGSISGMNNQLIIKSTPANIRTIKDVLATLDKAARQLLITVKQNTGELSNRSERGISGRYSPGDVTVESDGQLQHPDLQAQIEDRDGNRIQYQLNERSQNSDSRNSYRVRATEGYPAHILSGELYPFPRRDVYVGHGNVVVQDGYQYEDATSGFYVLPRLQGETVTLEIAPRMTTIQRDHGPPIKRLQDVQTVVSGRLGEWIPVGGVGESSNQQSRRLLGRSESQHISRASILIRVEVID